MSPNDKYENQIKTICEKSPCSCGTILKFKKELSYLKQYIEDMTAWADDLPFSARIWHTLNHSQDYAKCEKCRKDIPHNRPCRPLLGYDSPFCSQECSQSSNRHRQKIAETCMAKYGVDHPSKVTEIRKRISDGHLARSDIDVKLSNEKREKTNILRYGVSAPAQNPDIARKSSITQRSKSEAEKSRIDKKRR